MSYIRCNYAFFDYKTLGKITTITRTSKKKKELFNNVIIMVDTETSRKTPEPGNANHVCAFSIAIRYKHENICTLWGHKPSECVECIDKIMAAMPGEKTIMYLHNMAYDYTFLRKFFFREFGKPTRYLNVKPHYPIFFEFQNGLVLKDSYILAQKSLEKWANDLDVEHKKAVGKWDYDKIRNQDYHFDAHELDYIEYDVLAGVECIDKTMETLHHYIFSLPYTSTGIVRNEARKISRKYQMHDRYEKISSSYEVYLLLEKAFHGGYTHGNRDIIGNVIEGCISCYDFTSSYPYVMLTEKYPMTRFTRFRNATIDELINNSEKYAFITKLVMVKPRLKSDSIIMPVLQASKCTRSINAVIDNGRILCAGLVEIIVTEQTLKLIRSQYDYDLALCTDVYYSRKEYLPRWFTDYIFKLFKDKSTLKGKDLLNYMISKGKLNSCYGMSVQKMIQNEIIEDYDTGEYETVSKYTKENYEKQIRNRNKFLPYQWGVWVTEYAMRNLFELGAMCGTWLYSDTDSVYGTDWDEEAIKAYNMKCVEKLEARGYGAVEYEGKTYILGTAALDGSYSQFKVLGAKRYCVRADDGLHITVAGVPKKGVKCLNEDINNFQKGMIFDGKTTGKKQHTYIYVDDIYIDENGNETGDSIDLSECDYLLDDITIENWEELFKEDIQINVYDPN